MFLDEISWMGQDDPLFTGGLKQTFDDQFQSNKNLAIVLCGSVSSWISDHILKSTDFMGRIHLDIGLKELPIDEVSPFFGNRVSVDEKLLFLLHSGGVPRYLKEFRTHISAGELIAQLGFNDGGLFYNEFDRIFNDIFNKRAPIYKKIIMAMANGSKTTNEILLLLSKAPSGKISGYLNDLVLSGFIQKFDSWDISKPERLTKFTRFRLTDNYLRFYLKQIEPQQAKIKNNILNIKDVKELKGYEAFLGYQFESLILNNIQKIIEKLKISPQEIIRFGPYVQQKNSKQEACQIDLFIQTKNINYIIEIKYRSKINASVISEFENKINSLKLPKRMGLKKILIYHSTSDLTENIQQYFDETISFESLLELEK